ncbi:hypothetical protein [Deinococcus misasensis]|uniref:hypothetical protein n=1 Tax=Deinococcus misasensis TaxID=392413 RepID=UPI0012F900F1|nr:hypothetical protein [Deinococcus misasensis]
MNAYITEAIDFYFRTDTGLQENFRGFRLLSEGCINMSSSAKEVRMLFTLSLLMGLVIGLVFLGMMMLIDHMDRKSKALQENTSKSTSNFIQSRI